MPVSVMVVRHVGVHMPRRLVAVQVAVLTDRQRFMGVGVMPVAMAMGVFMFRLVVLVFVPVALGEVEHDARSHEHRAGQHPGTAATFTEQESKQGADKGREREHRAGARRAEGALRQQVEAQAEPVAGRSDHQQGQGRPQRRQGFA